MSESLEALQANDAAPIADTAPPVVANVDSEIIVEKPPINDSEVQTIERVDSKLPESFKAELGKPDLSYAEAYAANRFWATLAKPRSQGGGQGNAMAAYANAYGEALKSVTDAETEYVANRNVANKAALERASLVSGDAINSVSNERLAAIVRKNGTDKTAMQRLLTELEQGFRAGEADVKESDVKAIKNLVSNLDDIEERRRYQIWSSVGGGGKTSSAQGELFVGVGKDGRNVHVREMGGRLYPVGSQIPLSESQAREIRPTLQRAPTAEASQKSLNTALGKSFQETNKDIDDAAKRATTEIENNNRAVNIVDEFSSTIDVLRQSDNPLIRGVLTALNEGINGGDFVKLSFPLEKAIEASKSEKERSALQALQQILAGKTFAAVADANFKGAQSDKELAAIQQSIATTSNTPNAIKAFLIQDTAKHEIAKKRREMWNEATKGGTTIISVTDFNKKFDEEVAGPRLRQASKEIQKLLRVPDKSSRPEGTPVGGRSNERPSNTSLSDRLRDRLGR